MSVVTDVPKWTYGISWIGSQLVLKNGCWRILLISETPAIEALLQEIEQALRARLFFLAILLCLMLPDVCAALEAADGRTSEKRYKE